MAERTSSIVSRDAYQWGAISLFLALAAIVGALAFEHIGGYEPCPLCLQQRYAYYAAIPALFLALVLITVDHWTAAVVICFLAALAFLANAGLGVYHAGAEWGYWAAPTTCGGQLKPLGAGGAGLLKSLKNVEVVDCGKPALVILGLSLAGWNAVVSAILTVSCLKAAFAASERS